MRKAPASLRRFPRDSFPRKEQRCYIFVAMATKATTEANSIDKYASVRSMALRENRLDIFESYRPVCVEKYFTRLHDPQRVGTFSESLALLSAELGAIRFAWTMKRSKK
jgi:hypothetical protein